MTTPPTLKTIVLDGLTPYQEAYTRQLEAVEQRQSGACPDTLFLLEHPPVITLGQSASSRDVLATPELLCRMGIAAHDVERGGKVTYHGPGQVVGYPIIHLEQRGIGVQRYVAQLEETVIRTAAELGVTAFRKAGCTGVFCDQGKIGAIGVRITKGVAYHGFAFNVSPNLEHYSLIVPCGMADTPVTSIEAITGSTPPIPEVKQLLLKHFLAIFS
jgi:lipoyl(octanoyl) transferase